MAAFVSSLSTAFPALPKGRRPGSPALPVAGAIPARLEPLAGPPRLAAAPGRGFIRPSLPVRGALPSSGRRKPGEPVEN